MAWSLTRHGVRPPGKRQSQTDQHITVCLDSSIMKLCCWREAGWWAAGKYIRSRYVPQHEQVSKVEHSYPQTPLSAIMPELNVECIWHDAFCPPGLCSM